MTSSPVTNSPCAVPDELAACLGRPATNETQAAVLAWLTGHEYDRNFWINFPEKTARDIYQWARNAERWPYILGAPAWGIFTLTAAMSASFGVVMSIDVGGPLTITLGVLALLVVLLGGILFAVEILAKPWARVWNCEHTDALRVFVVPADKQDVKDLYRGVESSTAAVNYLNEVGKRRNYVANDFRIAEKLAPGYIPFFDNP